jgi:hypothetical protein
MKTGRNEKCHCGSGKKHKKCCLSKDESVQNAMNSITRQRELGTRDEHLNDPVLTQYFGYNVVRAENESPFELPEEGLCCMVSSVNRDIQREINAQVDFPILKLGQGQWVVTANIGNEVKFSGPYKSQELAFEAAKEKFDAIRFISAPNII